MRILHVTDTYLPSLGGIEMMVDRLATHQRAAGHDVRVLTRARGPALADVSRNPFDLGVLLRWADRVHVHLSIVSPLAFHAINAAAHGGRPVVASVHSMWSHCEGGMALAAQSCGWGRQPVQWAPVSGVAAESVRRALGPHAAIEVLPNAVDTDLWRTRHDPSPRPVGIAWVGRLARRKRVEAAVDVLAEMRGLLDPSVPVRVSIIGDGGRRRELERRLARRGLDGWVETPGVMVPDQLKATYATTDVFLSTCTLESFGLAALEARTAGLVVVGRAGTGFSDFITPGVDGLLADDDHQLAVGLAGLVADRARLDAMLAHTATVVPMLGWSSMLARCDEFYARAAGLRGVGRLPQPLGRAA